MTDKEFGSEMFGENENDVSAEVTENTVTEEEGVSGISEAAQDTETNVEEVAESMPAIEAEFEETAEDNSETQAEFTQEDSDEVVEASSKENESNTSFTDEQPKEVSDSIPENGYAGGVYYTKNTDDGITNGYEWDASKKEEEAEKQKKSKDKSDRGFKIFIGATLSVFTLSVVALAIMAASYAFDGKANNSSAANFSNNKTAPEIYDYSGVTLDNPNFVAFDFKDREGQVLSIPEIAAKCTPSSVGIVSEVETTTYGGFFSFGPSTRIAEASGSGFIYSADGYIITNHHVIEGANKVTVILSDNKEFEAEIIGSDSLSDIAVLKITPDESTKLIPMEIGNSDELVVGEGVVAIGCPAGVEFIGTVTDGIVSAINRNVELTDSYGTVQKTMTLIQTNATINHGNSGGPLINSRGQVIGINTLKLSSDYEGIGFSIPMSGALPIISQLIEHGEVIERTEDDFAYGKGIIGINGSAISEDEAEYYGIPQGVLVVQISKGGSASNAGLRRGDIITHYNGQKVETVDDINRLKGSARAGTEVTLTVYRDGDDGKGETLDITFKLDAQE